MSESGRRVKEALEAMASTDAQRGFVASLTDDMFPLQINQAAAGYFTDQEIIQANEFANPTISASPDSGEATATYVDPVTGQTFTVDPVTGEPVLGPIGGFGEQNILVGDDFTVSRVTHPPLPEGQVGPPLGVQEDVEPRYQEGDQFQEFTGLSTEQIALIQNQMVDSGVAQSSEFRLGVWDATSAEHMRGVMGFANLQGMDWIEALQLLEDTPLPAQAKDEFERQPFRRPNRAETEQSISDTFEAQLRRKPTRAELADLVDVWEDRVRFSFEVSEDERQRLDQVDRKRAEGDDRLVPGAGQSLDTPESPQSAFNRIFEEKYGGTIERNEDRDRARTRGLSFLGRDLP